MFLPLLRILLYCCKPSSTCSTEWAIAVCRSEMMLLFTNMSSFVFSPSSFPRTYFIFIYSLAWKGTKRAKMYLANK